MLATGWHMNMCSNLSTVAFLEGPERFLFFLHLARSLHVRTGRPLCSAFRHSDWKLRRVGVVWLPATASGLQQLIVLAQLVPGMFADQVFACLPILGSARAECALYDGRRIHLEPPAYLPAKCWTSEHRLTARVTKPFHLH